MAASYCLARAAAYLIAFMDSGEKSIGTRIFCGVTEGSPRLAREMERGRVLGAAATRREELFADCVFIVTLCVLPVYGSMAIRSEERRVGKEGRSRGSP